MKSFFPPAQWSGEQKVMRLSSLLSKVGVEARTHNEMDPEVYSLEYDSRRIKEDSIFFAIRGEVTDGHLYLQEALEKGAAAVVSERAAEPGFPLPWVQVPAARPYMAVMANEFYGHPSRRLQLTGITGTNGKTTTAYLVHSVLSREAPALLMGTVKTLVGEELLESERTTPEAIDIQRALALALDRGCRRGVMEVSSHALSLHRVYQCFFPVAVFTNLTQDHLDFHKTLENYFQAKRLLFQHHYNPGLSTVVLNADDASSARIDPPPGVETLTYGFSHCADVYPLQHDASVGGTELVLSLRGRRLALTSPLLGEHNIYNIMAAAAACSAQGIADDRMQAGIALLASVPGRFEKVDLPRPFTVIVDYAHTPHALENVLKLCRRLARRRILCVFGCGGDRDRAKRPVMGAIAVREADWAIVTSDNPRSEPPEQIVEEIRSGIPAQHSNYEVVVDRRQAIARALERAGQDDVILIAGKGHETYQEIGGRRIHFDDREVVKELL